MTTSEHADLIARLNAYAQDSWRGGIADTLREAAAALASTPSPAQPTEANEREALVRLVGSAVYGEPENLSRATEAADAILAAGFRLAPSPVQGADDRLAQAEKLIEDIQHLWRTHRPEVFHSLVRRLIKEYKSGAAG